MHFYTVNHTGARILKILSSQPSYAQYVLARSLALSLFLLCGIRRHLDVKFHISKTVFF